jgi:hypothetical protein
MYMRNLPDSELTEQERQQRVYDRAMASLHRQRLTEEGAGLALMYGWDQVGEVTRNTRLGKLAHAAQLLCIAFAFVVPCLLFIRVAL